MDVNVTLHASKDEVTAFYTTEMARKIGCFLKKSEKVLMATKRNRGQGLITIQVKGLDGERVFGMKRMLNIYRFVRSVHMLHNEGTCDMEIEITCSTAELRAGDNTFTTTITFVITVEEEEEKEEEEEEEEEEQSSSQKEQITRIPRALETYNETCIYRKSLK
ncbi:Malate dehydrogenase [Gossypium arboreum]|uniref:Malate dehydrogenase n=1 Tax=Gossypium arboreum TaxID=29729 RepID=A0A0B0N6J8_GOSAR|nr:Malate dehydrogenase [Gossypium arboreum]